MFIAKVTGSVISTQKVSSMVGQKLLIVEPYRLEPTGRNRLVTTGRTFVAADMMGAGVGDYVLLTQGSSARMTPETKPLPIDCAVIGIVDQAHIGADCVYSREDADTDDSSQPPATSQKGTKQPEASPPATSAQTDQEPSPGDTP
ncbi:MAG: EutN/CcmL family microcompartment protein [Pirellulaceae bacterium]